MSRIYKSENKGTTYQGAARSIGFNPRQAADQSKKTQQLKQAIVADGETKSREIQRVQRAENTVLQAQQEVDRSSQRIDQTAAKNNLGIVQATAKGDFANNLLFDQNLLKSEQTYDTNVLKGEQTAQNLAMRLDASQQQLSNQVSNARTTLVSSTINSLLDFGGSVVKYQTAQVEAAEAAKIKAQEEAEIKFQNSALLGDNFFNGGDVSPEVDAVSNANTAASTAEVQVLNEVADDIQSGNTAEDYFVAEQVRGDSNWSRSSDSRQNVYAARSQYPAFIAEAQANGLIRPGAQGWEDIQRLTQKFAKASGLNLSDPKLVADVFSKSALGAAQNALTAVTNQAATELKEARESNVGSSVTSITQGVPTKGVTTESVGMLWQQAEGEVVNGLFKGRRSSQSSRETTQQFAEALAASGNADGLRALERYAPNPDTPNLTLGKQFPEIFQEQKIKARQAARTEYNLGKGELNRQAETLLNNYWSGDASPEALRKTERDLRRINTPQSRAMADNLVQEGYNYDSDVARDVARARGTENEYSAAQIKDFVSKGTMSAAEGKEALKYAPDAKVQAKIDEGLKLYKPEAGIRSNAVRVDKDGKTSLSPDGKPIPKDYQARFASNAFKQALRMKEARFKVELGRRLQTVLRDNRDLDPTSVEFQQIMEKETAYLLKQDRFSINFNVGRGGYSFGVTLDPKGRIDQLTVQPGVQDVTGMTATDVFQTSGISKAVFDPSQDRIIEPPDLEKDSLAVLNGEKVSKRTNDWAAALGVSSKDLINGQRMMYDMPPLDRLALEAPAPSNVVVPGNKTAGMKALTKYFPIRGAAYMASAIDHESNWAAQRPSWDLGALDNAGRNGGLLSWNRGRLSNLEARYGRPIEQITEQEQLQFLHDELRTSYKDSYAIFMDPNASSGDLEWATWNYIRWNKKYTGTRWSVAENLIRWGNRNL